MIGLSFKKTSHAVAVSRFLSRVALAIVRRQPALLGTLVFGLTVTVHAVQIPPELNGPAAHHHPTMPPFYRGDTAWLVGDQLGAAAEWLDAAVFMASTDASSPESSDENNPAPKFGRQPQSDWLRGLRRRLQSVRPAVEAKTDAPPQSSVGRQEMDAFRQQFQLSGPTDAAEVPVQGIAIEGTCYFIRDNALIARPIVSGRDTHDVQSESIIYRSATIDERQAIHHLTPLFSLEGRLEGFCLIDADFSRIQHLIVVTPGGRLALRKVLTFQEPVVGVAAARLLPSAGAASTPTIGPGVQAPLTLLILHSTALVFYDASSVQLLRQLPLVSQSSAAGAPLAWDRLQRVGDRVIVSRTVRSEVAGIRKDLTEVRAVDLRRMEEIAPLRKEAVPLNSSGTLLWNAEEGRIEVSPQGSAVLTKIFPEAIPDPWRQIIRHSVGSANAPQP